MTAAALTALEHRPIDYRCSPPDCFLNSRLLASPSRKRSSRECRKPSERRAADPRKPVLNGPAIGENSLAGSGARQAGHAGCWPAATNASKRSPHARHSKS
jgi:hypothetical protein